MRLVLCAVATAFFGFGASVALAETASTSTIKTDIVEHGGGCRKSSPPGQCCHMDHSTGTVHCH